MWRTFSGAVGPKGEGQVVKVPRESIMHARDTIVPASLVAIAAFALIACGGAGTAASTSPSTTSSVPHSSDVLTPNAAPIRSAAAFARWKARLSVLDFVTYVSHARDTRILFLTGRTDTPSVQEARDCLAAAPAGKTLHIYEGGHYPVRPDANAFWRAWMVRNL